MDIDKILLKVMNNQASSEEYAALEAWKKESAENIHLLNQLSNQNKSETYKDYDKETAWKKVNARIEEPIVSEGKGSSKAWIMGIAALLFLGIAGYMFLGDKETSPSTYQSSETNMSFALEDNTEVWLRDGGNKLEVISDFQNERVVALSGEAFFDVAHNKEMPFYIELENDDRIKVVGTSFNLMTKGNELDLSIYDGIVELHTLNRVIRLVKGDRVTRINDSIVKVKNNNLNTLSWKNKVLIFDNTMITDVFESIENHFQAEITIQGNQNDLSQCLVRTKFTDESLESILEELSKLYDFKYSITNKDISITELTCP